MRNTYKRVINFIREQYGLETGPIPLHAPVFQGNEKKYLADCIDSTFVSSVGEFVDRFEKMVADFTGAEHAIATVNGTAALHVALLLAGVQNDDEVLTQAVTFIATPNAIRYCGAAPVFLDSDSVNLGLSHEALELFLMENGDLRNDGFTYNKITGKRISACVCMHVFGHPVKIDKIKSICNDYNIALVEDAAEGLGSFYRGQSVGTFGQLGTLSFNGNKTITTGGGGMILTNDKTIGMKAKHLTTTAKLPHKWAFIHDSIGYNYRLPNINAALGCAQMEKLPDYLEKKRKLADNYKAFFKAEGIAFVKEPDECVSNYWLNSILLNDREERDEFLAYSNDCGIMTRPLWQLMPHLDIYKNFQHDKNAIANYIENCLVNIPSGVTL